MKKSGSNFADTLFGTSAIDTIHGFGGNDLMVTGGGRDSIYGGAGRDLISGFFFDLDNIAKSPYRGAVIDGGTGQDTLIIDVTAAGGTSVLSRLGSAMAVKGVEETIYNVSAMTDKQVLVGTRGLETIFTSGTADVRGMEGNDSIFTGTGNDTLNGGDGNDFLSAGLGDNTLTGGKGRDMFMFQLQPEQGYQYSNITDFVAGQDKIGIAIGVDQFNLRYTSERDARTPDSSYGDGQGTGAEINDYASYDHGRYFGREDFRGNQRLLDDFVYYEKSTGSVSVAHYTNVDGVIEGSLMVVAHIEGNKNLHADDFSFLIL